MVTEDLLMMRLLALVGLTAALLVSPIAQADQGPAVGTECLGAFEGRNGVVLTGLNVVVFDADNKMRRWRT